jgi:hypothetical protein
LALTSRNEAGQNDRTGKRQGRSERPSCEFSGFEYADLHAIVARLSAKGVGFRCLQQGGMDTTTSTGELLLGVLASIAEFETGIRKERQREGIDRAKIAGVYKGRKPSVDVATVRALRAAGLGPSDMQSRWASDGRAFIVQCPIDVDRRRLPHPLPCWSSQVSNIPKALAGYGYDCIYKEVFDDPLRCHPDDADQPRFFCAAPSTAAANAQLRYK